MGVPGKMGRGALQTVLSSWDCWTAIPTLCEKFACSCWMRTRKKRPLPSRLQVRCPAFPGFCWSASSVSLGQLVTLWVEMGSGLHLFFFLSFLTSSFILVPYFLKLERVQERASG